MDIKTLILVCLPLIGSGQTNEKMVEKVVEYDREPERKYEAIIQEEYLNGASLNLYLERNKLLESCSSLSSSNQYEDLTLSIKRSDCESHHSACDHVVNFMSLIIEWILEENETLTEKQAIDELLYVQNNKKLIELVVNEHIRKYHNSFGLQQLASRRNTTSFFLELDNEHIVLSDQFKTSSLMDIKEFCFTIKDWALVNESKALREILRK
jgi:hypothetical protein